MPCQGHGDSSKDLRAPESAIANRRDLQSLRPPTEVPNARQPKNSRKTAQKGAEWVTVKQPKNSWKNTRNTRKTAVLTVFGCFSGVFPAVFRLLYRDPLGTLFGCFQCRAFGTSVGGRRDCKPRFSVANTPVLSPKKPQ